jgi:Fe2+ transport system protein FeoA
MSTKLSNITKPGAYLIRTITGAETTRLMEMGILPGIRLEMIRKAPTGFPIEIKVRNSFYTLRKSEAECIELEN